MPAPEQGKSMNNLMPVKWLKMMVSMMLGTACGLTYVVLSSSVVSAYPVSLENVEGENGELNVTGQLVDSPCRMTMDSHDQSIDLGTLASADLQEVGTRSQPVSFTVHLLGCLIASGHLRDARSDSTVWGGEMPVVGVSFSAPADPNAPELIKLAGVKGVALRMRDSQHRDIRIGSSEVPQLLTPGDNTLAWTIYAERVAGPFVPGEFKAVVNFRIGYD